MAPVLQNLPPPLTVAAMSLASVGDVQQSVQCTLCDTGATASYVLPYYVDACSIAVIVRMHGPLSLLVIIVVMLFNCVWKNGLLLMLSLTCVQFSGGS